MFARVITAQAGDATGLTSLDLNTYEVKVQS